MKQILKKLVENDMHWGQIKLINPAVFVMRAQGLKLHLFDFACLHHVKSYNCSIFLILQMTFFQSMRSTGKKKKNIYIYIYVYIHIYKADKNWLKATN